MDEEYVCEHEERGLNRPTSCERRPDSNREWICDRCGRARSEDKSLLSNW